MKLFLLSQNGPNGLDAYESWVVAARDEAQARTLDVAPHTPVENVSPQANILVRLLGTAIAGTKSGTILASFNAG